MRNRNKKRITVIASIIILLAFFAFFKEGFFQLVSRPLLIVFKPIIALNKDIGNFFGNTFLVFKEKSFLNQENKSLKEKIFELESRNLQCGIIEQQNLELKNLLSRDDKEKYMVASIILKPPQAPYDTLLLDAGLDNGIEKGMMVTAYGNVLIGYVVDVFFQTSKIKLISFEGEEINVVLQPSGISAIAIGRGGENFEIVFPRSVEVKSGDLVTTSGMKPLVVGIAERVEVNISDAFQKILFRIPLNIQELKYVMIKI
ncbi:MAG: rod shape-determining protein MreC [Patescibacteria group bacterium]